MYGFSSRLAHVVAEVPVDLLWPCTLDLVTDPRFTTIEAHLFALLLQEQAGYPGPAPRPPTNVQTQA